MSNAASGGVVRFTSSPAEPSDADVSVVLDTTWTPASSAGSNGVIVPVRDVAERVLSRRDLMAETSMHLDRWAAASGVVERLTIGDTSFWYYVRLRHWLWLEERILWAAIVDAIVCEYRPGIIDCAPGTDSALLDVLRLVAARDDIDLRQEPEPLDDAQNGAADAASARSDARPIAGTMPRPDGINRALLGRISLRLRSQFRLTPGSNADMARNQVVAARLARVRTLVDALGAEPQGRLLVVHEHARQQVDTPDGPRSMNPYLDPIVDELRGTRLEPIVLDIRAKAGDDAAWERIGAGRDVRYLPLDALSIGLPPRPAAVAPPVPDPAMAGWRDGLHLPIEVNGIDLGPPLAAEVTEAASRWLPRATRAIDRIQRLLERLKPVGIVLADEYNRQDWLAAARAAGVPVAAVQHGIIYPRHNGYIHASRPDSLRLPQRTYVFGRWERDLLRDASVYRDDEVVAGGSPRLDVVVTQPDARKRLRAELGVADGDRLVVLSGTWGGLYRRFHYPITLARLVDRPLPRVHIVIKLHPAERDEGPYRRIVEGAAAARGFEPPRMTTVQSIDLYTLLAAADAHLGIHSTVLTEAVVTRTPNLLAAGLAEADLLGYVAAGVALPVRDGAGFLAALDTVGDGTLRESDARAFADSHFEPGSASRRIAQDLLAWLQ
jgi:hypothetical protein